MREQPPTLRPFQKLFLLVRPTTRSPWRSVAALLLGFLCLVLLLLLLTPVFDLIFQSDEQRAVHDADRLFIEGHYYAALQHYTELQAHYDTPALDVRLGIVRVVRGEYARAQQVLWRAIGADIPSETRNIALLYLGQSFANHHDRKENALRVWASIEPCPTSVARCFFDGLRHVLQGEYALQQGEYATAEAEYRAALAMHLPYDWWSLAAYRLALLGTADDPDVALREWQDRSTARREERGGMQTTPDPLLVPLLPDIGDEAARLQAILHADATVRQQLLGQFMVDLKLYELADAYLDKSAPGSSPDDVVAASYAAYGRWQADDVPGALARLEHLVEAHPNNLHLRAMLVLAYLEQQESEAAEEQIDTMTTMAPYHSDTHIARAAVYMQQSEYVSATLKYKQAFFSAPEDRKGHYALLAARFHLHTNFGLCDDGLAMTDLAVRYLPDHADAWTILAASRYRCRDFPGAVSAAETALEHSAGAEAAYYLGAALAGLNNHEQARLALIRAADLEPASFWRQRAEQMLLDIR